MKACTGCHQALPLDSFRVHRRRYDGRDYLCRPCRRSKERAHYAENAELIRAIKRKETSAPHRREKRARDCRAWYRNNKNRAIQYARSYYAANVKRLREDARRRQARRTREDRAAALRRFHAANPEANSTYHQNRRARKALSGLVVRRVDIGRLFNRFEGRCAYCGERPATSIDHVIPLSRGGRHSIGNILPACGSCNSQKGTLTLSEWRRRLRRLEAA